ncbi:hypothetical protein OIU79_022889 [Salix purpurea]|uniref:Uncharacterized protein n=1 Tax=Salix purpurea TaxID=77065 RepID=A0A9Q0WHU9_SALPP|nr:hypothetical protein OIU79_022889 [Salix purpurea]
MGFKEYSPLKISSRRGISWDFKQFYITIYKTRSFIQEINNDSDEGRRIGKETENEKAAERDFNGERRGLLGHEKSRALNEPKEKVIAKGPKKGGPRDGEGRNAGQRDGELEKAGPREKAGQREGEFEKAGPREKAGQRDGELEKAETRDGEGRKAGQHDGEIKRVGLRDREIEMAGTQKKEMGKRAGNRQPTINSSSRAEVKRDRGKEKVEGYGLSSTISYKSVQSSRAMTEIPGRKRGI